MHPEKETIGVEEFRKYGARLVPISELRKECSEHLTSLEYSGGYFVITAGKEVRAVLFSSYKYGPYKKLLTHFQRFIKDFPGTIESLDDMANHGATILQASEFRANITEYTQRTYSLDYSSLKSYFLIKKHNNLQAVLMPPRAGLEILIEEYKPKPNSAAQNQSRPSSEV